MAKPSHPIVAAIIDPVMAPLHKVRAKTIPQARGRVLEVGAGTGQNFRHYRDAESIVAIEPDPHMRRRAERRVGDAPVAVELLDDGAEALPFADDAFDTVVATWVLCTIPDLEQALREMRRVLRPDGRLVFAEHVRSTFGVQARLQDLLNPAWKWCAGGCNLNRPAVHLLKEAGFKITASRPVGPKRWTITPMVVGEAVPT